MIIEFFKLGQPEFVLFLNARAHRHLWTFFDIDLFLTCESLKAVISAYLKLLFSVVDQEYPIRKVIDKEKSVINNEQIMGISAVQILI